MSKIEAKNQSFPSIGKGGFGNVHEERHNGRKIAVKVPMSGTFNSNELYMSIGFKHPNLMNCIGVRVNEGQQAMCMEKADMDLIDFVRGKNPNVEIVIKLALEIARGMEWMHTRFIAHCDLKPGNVLVFIKNGKPACKIADFGLSRRNTDDKTEFYLCGSNETSIRCPAPEGKDRKPVTRSIDIYAFGATLAFMLREIEPGQTLASLCDVVFCCCQVEPANRTNSFTRIIERLNSISEKHKASLRRCNPAVLEFSLQLQYICDGMIDAAAPDT